MLGWLVVHNSMTSEKFQGNFQLLQDAARARGIHLIIKSDKEIFYTLNDKMDNLKIKPDFAIFWDSDIYLAKYLQSSGIRLFNNANAIEQTVNKAMTHLKLHKENITMPRTIIAPRDINMSTSVQEDFLQNVMNQFNFPIIVKGFFGSFGKQVFLANNLNELVTLTKQFHFQPFMFQEFIASSRGRDIRLNIVGNRYVAAMYRYSDTSDFRANVQAGGKVKKFEPTEEQKEIAIQATKALDLDFAGVDLLIGPNGKSIVCEVNSSALIKTISECTGVNVAANIIDHIHQKLLVHEV